MPKLVYLISFTFTLVFFAAGASSEATDLHHKLGGKKDMTHYDKVHAYIVENHGWSLEEFCVSHQQSTPPTRNLAPYFTNTDVAADQSSDSQVEYVVNFLADFSFEDDYQIGGGQSFSIQLDRKTGDVLVALQL